MTVAAPVAIRPCGAGDLDAIVAMEISAFEHARWSRDSWAAELEAPGRRVVVVGDPAYGVATFSLVADEAELLRVIVAPERRDAGLGRALVTDGLEWAAAAGASRMLLEVEETNRPARALYAALGFQPLARRADYYAPGVDALVMEKELSHE